MRIQYMDQKTNDPKAAAGKAVTYFLKIIIEN